MLSKSETKSVYTRYKPVSDEGHIIEALKQKNNNGLNKRLLELVYMFGIIDVAVNLEHIKSTELSLEERDKLLYDSLRYFKDLVAFNEFQITELRKKKIRLQESGSSSQVGVWSGKNI